MQKVDIDCERCAIIPGAVRATDKNKVVSILTSHLVAPNVRIPLIYLDDYSFRYIKFKASLQFFQL